MSPANRDAPVKAIRPGQLVVLTARIVGGVEYEVTPLAEERDGVTVVSEWKTRRVTVDADEHAAAVKVRAFVRNTITGGLIRTARDVMLCPTERVPGLNERIERAREAADRFNGEARTCKVEVGLFRGEVRGDDEETARTIRTEVAALVADVERGIRAADPKAIREACDKAREIGAMLTPEVEEKVGAAIRDARKVARDMVAKIKEDGERAADTFRAIKLESLQTARMAFLDVAPPRSEEPLPIVPRALFTDVPGPIAPTDPAPVPVREIAADDAPVEKAPRLPPPVREMF